MKGLRSFAYCRLAVLLGASAASAGCAVSAGGEPAPEETVGQESAAIMITNCTGPAISSAIAAGGSITLSCGTSPITINVPSTTVTLPTSVTAAPAGVVKFTHSQNLFTVTSGASFSISGVNFDGSANPTASALVSQAPSIGSITVSSATFTNYSGGLIVHVGQGASFTASLCTFQGNVGSGFAAPIYSEGGRVNIVTSFFYGNRSQAQGGAITNLGGTLTIATSTFYFNTANQSGGAIYSSTAGGNGSLTVTNSTFASNQAPSGAAIFTVSPATVSYTTFSNNQGTNGTFGGTRATLNSSIILDTVAKSAPCTLSGSSNLQWPQVTPLCGPGFRFADPKLGNLAYNGGPTPTCALQAGSAADNTSTNSCPAADQRGAPRPVVACDVGSFEL